MLDENDAELDDAEIEDHDVEELEEETPEDEDDSLDGDSAEEETTEDADEGADSEEEPPAEEEEDDEGFYVSVGEDEEPPAPKETKTIRTIRQANRQANKRIRELERELKAITAPEEPAMKLEAKPTIEDFEWDADRFSEALLGWSEKKRQHEQQQDAQREQARLAQEAQQAKIQKYLDSKANVRNHDYETSEARVAETLSEQQQGLIVEASDNPVRDIYLLDKLPGELERLAKINDPARFIFELAKLQTQKGTPMAKKPPKPEKRVKGAAPRSSGSSSAKLDKLREEADRTGDRTALIRYKRSLKK